MGFVRRTWVHGTTGKESALPSGILLCTLPAHRTHLEPALTGTRRTAACRCLASRTGHFTTRLDSVWPTTSSERARPCYGAAGGNSTITTHNLRKVSTSLSASRLLLWAA